MLDALQQVFLWLLL